MCHLFLQSLESLLVEQYKQSEGATPVVHKSLEHHTTGAPVAAAASTSSWNASIASLMAFNGQFERGSTANVEKYKKFIFV